MIPALVNFVNGQQIADNGFKVVNDSLVARFNRGDFHAMYILESKKLKSGDSENGFVDYFSGLAREIGKVTQSRRITQGSGHHYFEWFCEKKNLRVDLVGSVPGVMDDYFVSDFVVQPGARTLAVKSDNPLKNSLDSAVQSAAVIFMSDPMTTGLSLGIWRDGKSYCYNYGEIKKGSGILPTANNEYNIGSIAKTFVGTLLAQAVVEGRVTLDDDIRHYLPGKFSNLEYQGHPVRLVNLANHTSGLPTSPVAIPPPIKDTLAKLSDSAGFVFLGRYYRSFNADSMLKQMHLFTVDTIPGVKYKYNGNAVSVLILILERIYHESYENILQRFLKGHFHISHTSSEFEAANLNRFVQPYSGSGEAMPIFDLSQFITAPSINTTVNDMLKYIEANIGDTDPAIKLTHKMTFADSSGNKIGLCWMLGKEDDGTPKIFHGGQARVGFTSLCVIYPGERTGYVILVNDVIDQSRLSDLQQEIRRNILQVGKNDNGNN